MLQILQRFLEMLQMLQNLQNVANAAEHSKCRRDLKFVANVRGLPGFQEFFTLLHLYLEVIKTNCSPLICCLNVYHFAFAVATVKFCCFISQLLLENTLFS